MDVKRQTAEIIRHRFGVQPNDQTLGIRFDFMTVVDRRCENGKMHIELIDRPKNIIHIFEYKLE